MSNVIDLRGKKDTGHQPPHALLDIANVPVNNFHELVTQFLGDEVIATLRESVEQAHLVLFREEKLVVILAELAELIHSPVIPLVINQNDDGSLLFTHPENKKGKRGEITIHLSEIEATACYTLGPTFLSIVSSKPESVKQFKAEYDKMDTTTVEFNNPYEQ